MEVFKKFVIGKECVKCDCFVLLEILGLVENFEFELALR